jgi:hypothetical protein
MRARRILLLVAVVALAGCGGGNDSASEDPGELVFDLAESDESGVAGVRATLTFEGRDRTRVMIDGLDEGEPSGGGANRAWIYQGTCSDLQGVAEELEPVKGPSSETEVNIGFAALINGDYAIVVGLPQQNEAQTQPMQGLVKVACGDVPDET